MAARICIGNGPWRQVRSGRCALPAILPGANCNDLMVVASVATSGHSPAWSRQLVPFTSRKVTIDGGLMLTYSDATGQAAKPPSSAHGGFWVISIPGVFGQP